MSSDSLLFEYIQDDKNRCVWLPRKYGMFWAQMRHHYMNKFAYVTLGEDYKVYNGSPEAWNNLLEKGLEIKTIHRDEIKKLIGEDA